jgi:dihydrofolate reductase
MGKFITCMASSLDGAVGSNNPKMHYLPWKPIKEDIARLKAVISGRTIVITRTSWGLLPASFVNFIKGNCKGVIILTRAEIDYGQNITTLEVTDQDFLEPHNGKFAPFLENNDLVYTGGAHFAEVAILGSDHSFITLVNDKYIEEKEGLTYI